MTSLEPAAVRSALHADGVVLLRGVIDDALVASLREARADLESAGRPLSRQVLYVDGPEPLGRPPLTALMDQWLSPHRWSGPGSTQSAAAALRPLVDTLLPGAVLFQDLMLVKKPAQRPFPWHQDYPYWPVDRPDGLVFWVPLTPTDTESGALRFAVGSQRLGPRPAVDLHDGRPQDEARKLGFDPSEWDWFAPRYEVGDAVVFLPTTFHGSPATTRREERAAWSSTGLSPGGRCWPANAPTHPLCATVKDGELVGAES